MIQTGCCARCGYELTGLPMQGQCPECGLGYDAESRQGIVRGLADKQVRAQRRAARLRTGCLGGLALGTVGCGGVISIMDLADHPLRPIGVGILFGAVFALAAFTSYLYETPDD